jgi:zinc finger protein CreA/MIG
MEYAPLDRTATKRILRQYRRGPSFKCPFCDKAFYARQYKTRHIRTHTGEKPHACEFPGCAKRFSRSDELTQHSRIHSNPKSKKNKKIQQRALLPAVQNRGLAEGNAMATTMLPPNKTMLRSASTSIFDSPKVSPRLSFTASAANIPCALNPHGNRSLGGSPNNSRSLDINLLAIAATQVEQESCTLATYHPHHSPRHPHNSHSSQTWNNLPSLSDYTMSSSHSRREYDDYSHRHTRPSRPNSPNSTALPLPTSSHGSLSPTPDHTHLAALAHSPYLRPYDSGHDLPPIRNPPRQHTRALTTMEPQYIDRQYHASKQATSTAQTIFINDIISRIDSAQRKLPILQAAEVAKQQFLNGGFGPTCR